MSLKYLSSCKIARRTWIAALMAQFLLLSAWGFPLQGKSAAAKPKNQKTDSRHQIELLEDKWRNAVLSGDATVLDSLLAEDYVGIMPNGTLQTKDQTLSSMRSGAWHFTTLDMSDRKIRFYGRTALVTSVAQVEGRNEDGTIAGSFRYTRVYARDSRGVWKIVNFETNRIGHSHEPKNQQ